MAKSCQCPDCHYRVFAKGYCKYHQWMRSDKKPKQKKPQKPIRPRTAKRAKEYDLYRILREEFFNKPENQKCRVFPWLPATDVHHMKGKIGKLLNDVRFWLPVSRQGHEWIEANPEKAMELGFCLSRLAKAS